MHNRTSGKYGIWIESGLNRTGIIRLVLYKNQTSKIDIQNSIQKHFFSYSVFRSIRSGWAFLLVAFGGPMWTKLCDVESESEGASMHVMMMIWYSITGCIKSNTGTPSPPLPSHSYYLISALFSWRERKEAEERRNPCMYDRSGDAVLRGREKWERNL